jgi:aspartyl-tRNA synthetase
MLVAKRIEFLGVPTQRINLAQLTDNPALRARYRYVEFRSPNYQARFRLRHRIWLAVSQLLDARGYVHVDTPILATPSSSGANEFTVISGRDQNLFYALPQSPQLYGHLLVLGGIARYFQWARCFRDEDLRVNRQPEFTQLHIEAAFIDEEELMAMIDDVLAVCFDKAGLGRIGTIERLSFDDARALYGTDKPDLRLACQFEFLPFRLAGNDGELFTCALPEGMEFETEAIGAIEQIVAKSHLRLLGYVERGVVEGTQIAPVLRDSEIALALSVAEHYSAGARLLLNGEWSTRNRLSLGLYQWLSGRLPSLPTLPRPVWITRLPLIEEDASAKGRLKAYCHPFLAPQENTSLLKAQKKHELLALRGRAFDLVINGEEVGSGSMLINEHDLQLAFFRKLGYSKKEAYAQFGAVLDAIKFGAPPIGGFGLGIERLIAQLSGTDKIRDVIAFPKSRNGLCPIFQSY